MSWTTTPTTHASTTVLPPRGFLLALLAQVPAMVMQWPWQPHLVELAAGVILIACGVVMNVWAERLFRSKATGVCPFSPATAVVARGPYRVSRNPMYLGLVAISVGLTLATGVLSNIGMSAGLAIWLKYAYVLPEEAFMRARFGAAYDAYASRTSRWLLF